MSESRPYPVCHTGADQAKMFLKKNLDSAKLVGLSFASRNEPEYTCHQLVQYPYSDLVYDDQPPQANELTHVYHVAAYDSSEEANNAAASYIHTIRPTFAKLTARLTARDIGTGTGIFLECLSHEGFSKLVGIEPSSSTIAAAPEYLWAWIRKVMFDENDFATGVISFALSSLVVIVVGLLRLFIPDIAPCGVATLLNDIDIRVMQSIRHRFSR